MSQKDVFFTELIANINRFVETEVEAQPIEVLSNLPKDCYISQNVIGDYCAFTAVYGDEKALCDFAIHYSKFDIDSFDDITKEVLADFLNLHNGLFTVNLSNEHGLECSLLPPCMSPDKLSDYEGTMYRIPVQFEFGLINFVLSER